MQQDLTTGNITGRLLQFALPMMLGNLLQQLYNVADTLIVGRFLGADALAAVGSSYTLMTFLTSVLLGLCMGSGAVFSIQFGRHDTERLKHSVSLSFLLIAAVTFLLNAGALCGLNGIIRLLRVPAQVTGLMKGYLKIIFWGDRRHVLLQLLRLPAAFHRKFYDPTPISRGSRNPQHRA